MRTLITGGTGFIGSRLAARLLEEGFVRILGQENTPAEAENRARVEAAGAEVLIGSVDDPGTLARGVEGIETVFHLAAAQHEMNIPDEHFWNVNVRGTENLLAAAVRAGVRRFVHGSTIGVYGVPAGPLDEESPTTPDNIYGTTKLAGEERVLAFSDRIPVVVVRIPEVYGPGDRRLLKLFRSIEGGRFFLIGRGENLHHPIFVDDLIEGIMAAARSPDAVGEIILLAGKESVTTREMTAAIASAVGREPRRWHAPLLPFVVTATILELSLRPLGVQPPLHRRRLDFFRKSHRLSADKARRLLSFDPRVDFEEGARRTAEWYRSAGLL